MRVFAAVLAAYPIAVAGLIVAVPLIGPRNGPLALVAVLSMHLALAALVLVPVAFVRDATALRLALVGLLAIGLVRFGGEWLSVPAVGDERDLVELRVLSWNLELGARAGPALVDGLRAAPVDVITLQELGPEHIAAIEADADLAARFPHRVLEPRPGVMGMGVLSRFPITRTASNADDPVAIEVVLDIDGQPVTVIDGHPLPGIIGSRGPIPLSFDPARRDRALDAFRDRVDAAIGRGETVIVAGDFNVAPTEPAYAELSRGLRDAHVEVGLGPGWTWRPSRFEPLGIGLLRIDLALAGPGARPIDVGTRCDLPGDHCQLIATFALEGR